VTAGGPPIWALAVAAAAATPAVEPGLEAQLARVLYDLELEARGSAGWCLSIDDRDRAGIAPLVRGALERGGRGRLLECEVPPGPEAAAKARARGAEVLLAIRLAQQRSRIELYAELQVIDRGLWAPAPAGDRPVVLASAAATIHDAQGPPIPAPPIGFDLERIGHLSARVLALAACDLDQDGRPELVSVGDRLEVQVAGRGKVTGVAALTFAGRAGSKTPVRDPIASVVCADLDASPGLEIAFGHSALAQGALLKVAPKKSGRWSLAEIAPLPAVPLAATSRGLLLSAPDAGINRWERRARLWSSHRQQEIDLGEPVFALVGAGAEWWALDTRYQLRALSKDLALGSAIDTSGVGAVVGRTGAATWLVTTSSAAAPGDQLRVRRLGGDLGRTVNLPAPLTAATAAGPLLFLATAPAGGGADLWRLALPEEP
jgi:hypothetical protein